MQLLSLKQVTREVEYQGFTLEIPTWCNYVATDSTGNVYAYEAEPVIRGDVWVEGAIGDAACYVASVSLDTPAEWVSSCMGV